MGYSALLFCPEEKTARTVTQVLSELEFTVEACTEPFAAVKKLMGQHFDAVVVDCDNEQNATLLFKSARNSASNQTSLAVAVVEGQAGVANAFRIGANLVLTKPINIEQSKGTLRVARGLLRKGEPAKAATPAAPAPAATPGTPKPAAPKTIAQVKPQPPIVSPLSPEPSAIPATKPTPAWPAALASASASPATQDDDLLGIDNEEPKNAVVASDSHPALDLFSTPNTSSSPQKPGGSGAASAAAPARERIEVPEVEQAQPPAAPAVSTGKLAETTQPAAAAIVGPAPSFSFGGMNADAEAGSSGGSKKIIIGAVAAIAVAAGLYAGITHFSSSKNQTAKPGADPTGTPTNISQPVANTPKPAAPVEKPTASSFPSSQSSVPESNKIAKAAEEAASTARSVNEPTPVKSSFDSDAESGSGPEPLMVKGGGRLARAPKAVADAPAPSVIGIADAEPATPPAGLVPTAGPALRPTLSTLHVSQGVSTGLLIKKVAPAYPPSALRMHIEGDVELLATISKDGTITQIKVLSGNSQLTKAAAEAVKQWKYKPYLLNGEPVEIQTQVTVKFKLPG